jgi:molecular chaperone GrpE
MSEEQSLQTESEDTAKDQKPEAAPLEGEVVEALEDLLEEQGDTSALEELNAQLSAALQRAEDYRNQALRTQADMENLRRRTEKEVQDARKFALERFAKDLLVVVDSLELGIQASIGDAPEVVKHREGSELTLKQLLQILEKYNVRRIEAQGQKFDPALHQAMTMEPTDEVEPNTVTKVFQQGYTLNDRLLRPAMVVIAQKKA